jgi:hypothetical protein
VAIEPSLHVARELAEVAQALVQQVVDARLVHGQVPVDEHVAETGDPPETPRELSRHDADLARWSMALV